MKIALIVAVVVVLFVLVVVAIGALLPKQHTVTRSARFRSKPEQLFALIAGPPTWRPDVKKYEIVTNASGREVSRETDSNGETIDYEVVEKRLPVLLKRRIATAGLPYGGAWTFALQEDNGFTTVSITEEGEIYNPVFRFVSRFILGYTRTMDSYLTDLAKAVGEQIEIRD